jgi:anti-sigma regulatory factor (Ser/Thr protein kinase)
VASKTFPARTASVPLARAFLADVLAATGVDAWPAELLLTELATNVVLHACTEFVVAVDVGTRVRVQVRDGSSLQPAVEEAALDAERGRGMVLIEALADAWGVSGDRDGKFVWFELAARPRA